MSDSGDNATGGWWSSWMDKAKQTSSAAFTAVKRDLNEFVRTVTSDTSEALATTKDAIKEKLQVSESKDAVNVEEKTSVKSKGSTSSAMMLETISTSRSEAELSSLRNDVSTYCSEPDDATAFSEWSSTFNIESCTKEISELLVSNDKIRAFQTKLVPSTVSYKTFWTRYFYRVNQWKKEQERRARLIERAEQQETEENELDWEDEDDGGGGEEGAELDKGYDAASCQSDSGSLVDLLAEDAMKGSGAESPVSTSSESFVTLPLPGNNGSEEAQSQRSSEEPCRKKLSEINLGSSTEDKEEEKEKETDEEDWESWDS